MNDIPRSFAAGKAVLAPLPFTRFTLGNGLTVIVHEDRKAPIVAVAIWYRVGSGDEPAGKHGFAHLFEHLMFSGSENFRRPYHDAFSHLGASDLNGTTWFDRTNYFVTVPKSALDVALWVESDRMGHLLGAVGQAELDMQRGIVRNEKMQNESRPYGKTPEVMLRNAYPANHPYAHTTIGSMEDLAASSLDDVRAWFRTHYGAASATLVLSGDVSVAEARAKAEFYFGDIDPGPPTAKPLPWAPRRAEPGRGEIFDRVPHAMFDRQWNGPAWGDTAFPLLELAAGILGGGETSRLYRRLVRGERIATMVSARCQRLAVTSPFNIRVFARQPSDLARIEAVIDEEIAAFKANGPTAEELQIASGMIAAAFNRDLEHVGGMSGKAALLGEGQALLGLPDQRRRDAGIMLAATPDGVAAALRAWIDDGHYTLVVRPGERDDADAAHRPAGEWPAIPDRLIFGPPVKGEWAKAEQGADRSTGIPKPGPSVPGQFPDIDERDLRSGLKILSARRPGSPVVQLIWNFPGGSAQEPLELPGIASFTADAMMEGTTAFDALALRRRLDQLGARLMVTSGPDASRLMLNVPSYSWDAAVDLVENLLRHPAFESGSIDHVRDRRLAAINRILADPGQVAQTLFPTLLLGKDHPYGRVGSGFGTVDSLRTIGAADVGAWHRRQFQARGGSLAICGDVAASDAERRFEAMFADALWQEPQTLAPIPLRPGADAAPRFYFVDIPGAAQSVIMGGTVAAPFDARSIVAARAVNSVFGGDFEARLNMNLREDKHWAYGAGSSISERSGPGAITMNASVQQDRTADALREMMMEAEDIWTRRPPTAEELQRVKEQALSGRAARYETAAAVCGKLAHDALLGFAAGQAVREDALFEALTVDEAAEAAAAVFGVQPLRWLVVGDASKIGKQLADMLGAPPERIDPRDFLGHPD